MPSETTQIIELLSSALPEGSHLHTPTFEGNERKYLDECITSTFVSSVGPFVDRVEEDLTQLTGVERAIAVCSGTAALHTCLHLLGVGSNDEVLMPALTFVATANAALHCHATPHFLDIEEESFGIDPEKLRTYLGEIAELRDGQCWNVRTGRRIAAVIPVHVFGFTCKITEIVAVAKEFSIPVVEDAAEGVGTRLNGKHVGSFGTLAALSFNGNKIVTAGGGGAILSNNKELGDRAKHITTTAKLPSPYSYVHDQMGFNYRMPNVNAALACAQLEQLDSFIEKKRTLFTKYQQLFESCEFASIVSAPKNCSSNYWLINLKLDKAKIELQKEILDGLHQKGIFVRPPWKCLHQLEFLKTCPRSNLSTSELAQKQLISLPSSAHQGFSL